MGKTEFYKEVEDLLELEDELEVNDETTVEDILDIDSLAHITLISFIKDELGVEVKAEEFSEFETLSDLVARVGSDKIN